MYTIEMNEKELWNKIVSYLEIRPFIQFLLFRQILNLNVSSHKHTNFIFDIKFLFQLHTFCYEIHWNQMKAAYEIEQIHCSTSKY